ncbi:MAG: hypothetical protein KIS79_08005, partial [Burkholderiales bacterium]|nr:hypothetical protein [Burkholderiales bacterium]
MKAPLPPGRPMLRVVKHGSLRLTRWIAWGLGITVCLVFAAFLLLRYVLLPRIDDYRGQIAAAISRAAGQRVSIGAVEGRFDGVHPHLALRDVRVYDTGGVERLALGAVDGWLSWTSLPAAEPRFRAIELQRLDFEVRRDAQRRLWVAGMPLQQEAGKGGFGDWLLEQHRVTVRDSSVTWIDETLGGTPLPLQETTLQIEKRLRAWHFALRSVPPEQVAGPMDLHGDLSREGRGAEAKWSGKLFFRLGYADLSTLRQWLAIPLDISQGAGTIEAWSRIDAGRLSQLSADVALSDVNLRLRPSLPQLALSRMSGRLSWEEKAGGETYAAQQLSFTTPDGVQLAPADISYHRQGEEGASTAHSQLTFDRLDLVAVTRLLDRLPLDEGLRRRMAEAAPHGLLRDFDLRWVGPFQARSSYQLHTSFEQLGSSPSGYLPGFSAVSGALEASDKGGAVTLRAGHSEVDMPLVFGAPLPLEILDARVTWSGPVGRPLVRIEHASFANTHLTGQISGSYRVVPDHPGTMDLSGTLTRGDAREVWRYIPLIIHEKVRSWLKDALVAGRSEDVRFRLRGDLRRFPFVNPEHGIFEVVTRFHDGSLAFAPGWPVIEGISGELVFRAASMTVNAPQGRLYGTVLRDVTASIPDLSNHDQVLHVRGVAEGPSQDFLRYIEDSEVDRWIGGFTRGMRASGAGTLALTLALPLHRMHQTTVQGSYRFAGNTLEPGHGAPRLEQLNGELRFSERDVRIADATVRVLGMPARFS